MFKPECPMGKYSKLEVERSMFKVQNLIVKNGHLNGQYFLLKVMNSGTQYFFETNRVSPVNFHCCKISLISFICLFESPLFIANLFF